MIDWNIFSYWARHYGYDPSDYNQYDVFGGRTWFAVGFTNPALRDEFNQGIRQLKRDGSYQEIYDQLWTPVSREVSVTGDTPISESLKAELTATEVAWLNKHPVIRVSNESDYRPLIMPSTENHRVFLSIT